MKRGVLGLGVVAAGLLMGCAPAPLRAQPDAALRVQARLAAPPVTTLTGDELYRQPGPGALLVWSDRPAFITSLFVPPAGGVRVLPTRQVQAGETTSVVLPASLGFTQVFTVASLQPLDLSAAQGARSLQEAARVVEAQASRLPRGAYTVATTAYRVGSFGAVRVSASQPGAEVRVNGRLAGYAPLIISDLPESKVTIEVSRSGFVSSTYRVDVVPNVVTDVQANLRPVGGTLIVRSAVPARVLVAGESAGVTPVNVWVRPGNVTVNVIPVNSALKAESLLVRIKANGSLTISCTVNSGEYVCRTQ